MIVSLQIDTSQVQGFMDAMPRQIFEANKFAVARATASGHKQLQQEMHGRLKIPKSVWRRWRTARRFRRDTASGVVWLGVNELKAAYAGKLEQNESGSFAGQYYFPGSFIATMKSGHTGIFHRTGVRKKRDGKWWSEIKEDTVNLNLGFEVVDDVARQTQAELGRLFIEKVLELNPYLQGGN